MSDVKPTFDMSSMGAALADITNGKPGSKPDGKDKDGGASKDAEQWVPREAYDYRLYNAQTREEREQLAANNQVELPDWAANAQKYEWSDDYGDIGPEHLDLEKQLFGGDFLVRRGQELEKLTGIRVAQESKTRISPIMKFEDAGLHPIMLKNVKLCGYEVCTPIQAYCIPAIIQGHDVFASAQTGSGKTAAFLIPMLSKLMGKAKIMAAPRPNPATFDPATDSVRAEPLVVIVSPTRELATQIFDEARRFCYRSMLRPSVIYGGAPLREQVADLRRGCDVLIGTPGRLCDLMDRAHVLSLRRVRYTVVDEADEMLDLDWEEQLRRILHGGDNNPDDDHQYLMFSATFPKRARELARHFLAVDHVQVRVGRPGSTHVNIRQQIVWVEEDQKKRALYDLLLALPPARTIIFVNSKRTADLIDDYLFNLDLPSTSIHADRTQREREDALRAFRKGRAPILVATGVSARGLDIRDVMHIVNYDLPLTTHGGIDEYVHRIGRTARIGNVGLATSFYNDRNEDIAEVLVKTLLEADQQVPDFLSQYVEAARATPDGKIDFDDSSSSSDASESGKPAVGEAGDKEQARADDDVFGDTKPDGDHVSVEPEPKAEEVKTAHGLDPVSAAALGLTPVAAAAAAAPAPTRAPPPTPAPPAPIPAPAAAPAAPSILGANGGETKPAKAPPPAEIAW